MKEGNKNILVLTIINPPFLAYCIYVWLYLDMSMYYLCIKSHT